MSIDGIFDITFAPVSLLVARIGMIAMTKRKMYRLLRLRKTRRVLRRLRLCQSKTGPLRRLLHPCPSNTCRRLLLCLSCRRRCLFLLTSRVLRSMGSGEDAPHILGSKMGKGKRRRRRRRRKWRRCRKEEERLERRIDLERGVEGRQDYVYVRLETTTSPPFPPSFVVLTFESSSANTLRIAVCEGVGAEEEERVQAWP
jgi:hypothetical protein